MLVLMHTNVRRSALHFEAYQESQQSLHVSILFPKYRCGHKGFICFLSLFSDSTSFLHSSSLLFSYQDKARLKMLSTCADKSFALLFDGLNEVRVA